MIKIITDTTACLPASFARENNISVIPQLIHFGAESFLEGIELDQADFLSRLRTTTDLPKTAAPPPDLFCQEFEKLGAYQGSILCIHPSANLSGTVRSAQVAAREFPYLDIRILDTGLIAAPLGSLVRMALECAQQGSSIDEIVQHLELMRHRNRIYFLVDTLEYLARGGRIGSASALLGGILQIKPILTLSNGSVEVLEKARISKKALQWLKQITTEAVAPCADCHLVVMQADAEEQARKLAEELRQILVLDWIEITGLPPAIITHGGPGILAVSYFV